MRDDFQEDLRFEAADDAADDGQGLLLDIDGYEGPLHLLLELARKQKVDLARISILELAEQYIVRVAKGAKYLEGRAKNRAQVADYCAEHITEFDRDFAQAEFDILLERSSHLKAAA